MKPYYYLKSKGYKASGKIHGNCNWFNIQVKFSVKGHGYINIRLTI